MTQEELKILQGMFDSSEKRMSQMMDDKLESVKSDLESVRSDLKREIRGVDMRLERDFKEIKGLLKEDYARVEGNAAKGAAAADVCKEIRGIQADHARAIQQHNERITVLEGKAI